MPSRLDRLRAALAARKVDAALISSPPNVRYLSGFTGTEGSLLITDREALFLTDSRYTEQAGEQVAPRGFSVITFKQKFKEIGQQLVRLGVRSLGYEDETTTVVQQKQLAAELGGAALEPLGKLATNLRVIKDAGEIAAIRRAVKVQEQALEMTAPAIRPGESEWDFALALEFEMRRLGASAVSFETIVGSGPRGAMPHGVASEKKIAAGEMVVIDWGCLVDGYCSDQTITVAVGEPSDPDARAVYDIVRRAQQAGLDAVRPGAEFKAIDKAAREVIVDAGYGERFGHGTGHALGLEIHEEPRVSPLGVGTAEVGMVFTIEPGIYLPGRFGVRLEDIVLVTERGGERLTGLSKDWRSAL
jgi:Xaa-Pro aminopeptidase